MWHSVFIVVIFISALFPFIGEAQFGQFPDRDFKCRSDAVQFGRSCRYIVLPYLDCPNDGNSCGNDRRRCLVNGIYSNASKGCREGFTRDREVCISNVEVDRGAHHWFCEAGFLEHDGICKKASEALYVCTESRTEDCKAEVFDHDHDWCPTGYVKSKHYYSGWSWSYYYRCRFNQNIRSYRYCNSGSTLHGDKCLDNSDTSSRIKYCPIGVLNHDNCKETVRRSTEYVCSGGKPVLECTRKGPNSVLCGDRVTTKPVPTCPTGYEFFPKGEACLSTTEYDAEYSP